MKKILLVAAMLLCLQIFAQEYKANQKVFIHYQEAWFPGKILKIEKEGYLVSYDDYDESWNEVVQKNRLSLTGKEKFSEEASSSDVEMALEHLSAEDEPIESVNSTTTSDNLNAKLVEVCQCWEKANKSGFLTDKEACLDIQDRHKAAMESGSQEYMEYKEKANNCKTGASTSTSSGKIDMQSKISEVCNCFGEAKRGNRVRVDCLKLQGSLGGAFEEDAEAEYFLQETMKCDQ
ncbi:MAG: agenet domain-containing protein [Bacteroidota bacterium]